MIKKALTLKEVEKLFKENVDDPKKLKKIITDNEAVLGDKAKKLWEVIEDVEKLTGKWKDNHKDRFNNTSTEGHFKIVIDDNSVLLESQWIKSAELVIKITNVIAELYAKLISTTMKKERQKALLENMMWLLVAKILNRLKL